MGVVCVVICDEPAADIERPPSNLGIGQSEHTATPRSPSCSRTHNAMEPTRGTVKLADPHDGNDGDDEQRGLGCRCAQRRVAVEVSQDGRFTWRFVPDARRAPGVDDEGSWPRVVDFCG
jgi:hypothetical protein